VKTVSFIIVNYNTAELALRCIRSVVQHTSVDYEIILVDNHSPEGGLDIVSEHFPFVRLIHMDRNIGFGKACNEAVRQSTGRYLFFLNPDTALGNDAVPVLLRFYEERSPDRPEPGCMGVLLRDEQGNPVHSFGEFPRAGRLIRRKCGSLLRKVFGVSLAEMSTDSIFSSSGFLRVDHATGAAIFISRERFDMAGGFDPDFFMYFEETDLQFRLAQKSFASYLVLGADITHLGGRSAVSAPLVRVLYFESLLKYMKKRLSPLQYFLFSMAWYLLDIRTVFQSWKPSVRKWLAARDIHHLNGNS
jgi:GT2 family glycosyltransferase